MFKIVIGLGLSVFLTNSAFAEVNYYPPPPPPPLYPIEPSSYLNGKVKPDNEVYMTKQEYQAMSNDDYFENEIFNMEKSDKQIKQALSKKLPNYSIDLGENKKEKILQAIKDFINKNTDKLEHRFRWDKHGHLYDMLGISYKEKYSKQCPIGYKNNGIMDKNICHETYDEYLSKLTQDILNMKKNIINHPTFWNDIKYDIPDSKYISNKVNDVFVYEESFVINFSNVCIKKDDINSIFKYKPPYTIPEDGLFLYNGADISIEFLKEKTDVFI